MGRFAPCALVLLIAACNALEPKPRDTTAPTLQITAPVAGTIQAADSLAMAGSVTDSISVRRVTCALNGGPEQELPVTPAGSVPSSFVVRRGKRANHAIRPTYDPAGNIAEAAVRVFRDGGWCRRCNWPIVEYRPLTI